MARICQPATDWQKAEICLDTSFMELPKYALAYAAHKMAHSVYRLLKVVAKGWTEQTHNILDEGR